VYFNVEFKTFPSLISSAFVGVNYITVSQLARSKHVATFKNKRVLVFCHRLF